MGEYNPYLPVPAWSGILACPFFAPPLVPRRYRNRRIGDFLKELKLTEGRCTGIPKIIQAMKHNGSPPPVFKTDEERSYFLTILYIHPGFPAQRKNKETAKRPKSRHFV